MDNLTLLIDPGTDDLTLDNEGTMLTVDGAEAVAQNVRLTLETFLATWFLDLDHGTDYDRIVGDAVGDIDSIIRAAIFQEPEVQYIDTLTAQRQGRQVAVSFSCRLKDGSTITMEVTAG